MRRVAILLFLVATAQLGAVVAEAKCPQGRITCSQWCSKFRSHAMGDCMGPRGCAGKPQGAATCVRDGCNPANDSCRR